MNRKLLVIAMVPLLIGFAGAMAFSEWSGSITKTITVSTATVTVKESVECVGAYIAGTVKVDGTWTTYGPEGSSGHFGPIYLDGDDHGHVSSCPSVEKCYGPYTYAGIIALDGQGGGCSDPDAFSLGTIEFLGPGVTGASYNLNVYGLAPGDWIDLGMFEHVAVSDDGPPVELSASLTPSALSGLVGATTNGPLVPSGTFLGYSNAAGYTNPSAGGWTWLPDSIETPCESQYGLVSGSGPSATLNPIDAGTSVSPHQSFGLEYCASGPLAPGNPTLSALSPSAGPLTVGPLPYAYILVGLDQSAVDGDMGITGATLAYATTATSP